MLSDNQKLNAIVWGAKKHGISYGEFSAKLTEEKCKQIYTEYENSLIMKQKKDKMAQVSVDGGYSNS